MDGLALALDELRALALSPKLRWRDFLPGVQIHRLWGKAHTRSGALLRYAPGGQITYAGAHEEICVYRAATGKVELVPLDRDVFGDGSVIMLYTPGHTPGHHSLLVKLPQMGAVLISGDCVHFRENYETNGVPIFNTDRSQTLASLDRVKKIVAGAKATVVIQHDARDIDKLPAFPAAAK